MPYRSAKESAPQPVPRLAVLVQRFHQLLRPLVIGELGVAYHERGEVEVLRLHVETAHALVGRSRLGLVLFPLSLLFRGQVSHQAAPQPCSTALCAAA